MLHRGWSPGQFPHGSLNTLVVSMSGHWTPLLCPWSPVSYLRKNRATWTSPHPYSFYSNLSRRVFMVYIHPWDAPGREPWTGWERLDPNIFLIFLAWLDGFFLYLEGKFLVSSRLIGDSWLKEKGRLFILLGEFVEEAPACSHLQRLG